MDIPQTDARGAAHFGSIAPAPRRPRLGDKRALIVAAARAMFFLEGYSGASMDRITARAGVSKATVYRYFSSKEEILLAVVQECVEAIDAKYAPLLDASVSFDEWLLKFGRILVTKVLLAEVIALQRLVIAEALRFPELGRTFRKIAVDCSLETFAPEFEQAMESGLLRPCDARSAIKDFATLAAGPFQQRALFNNEPASEAEIEQHIRGVVDHFLYGYANPQVDCGRKIV